MILKMPSPSRNHQPSNSTHSEFSDKFIGEAIPLRQKPLRHGNKKYHCPCGSTISRNDVLARHIKNCDMAKEVLQNAGSVPKKQTRSKRACNRCAASRLKCDAQKPCQRCCKKSLTCEYTRSGYVDPYEVFRIDKTDHAPEVERHSLDPNAADVQRAQQPSSLDIASSDALPLAASPIMSSHAKPLSMDFVSQSGNLGFMPIPDFIAPFSYMDAPASLNQDLGDMDFSFDSLDWDDLMHIPNDNILHVVGDLPTGMEATVAVEQVASRDWNYTNGLPLQRVDLVEAKCIEMRKYLTNFTSGVDHEAIIQYITRDRLVDCIQLFAKHYHSIQPIIHLPTFELTNTPPDLLLAMMLVGACYSKNIIPPSTVVQAAIHTVLTIESSSHERTMKTPPLPTIQANALLCQLLIMTKKPQAWNFSSMHRARTRSMAERANIFKFTEPMDYRQMNESCFSWSVWSELEMRKRLAYHIYVDDIGSSIFTRCTPHFSPFTFFVETPCYWDCWVAPTASECFDKLRATPPSMRVADAVKLLRSASAPSTHLFAASDIGMLELVISLHCMLFRAIEESLDDENIVPSRQSIAGQEPSTILEGLFNRDHIGYEVVIIANELVMRFGSYAIKRVNDAFDTWQRNWKARVLRDIYDEKHEAFSHPTNFWLLGKLFLVLLFFRNHNRNGGLNVDGIDLDEGSNMLSFMNLIDGSAASRLSVQANIIGWLSKIRQRGDGQSLRTENYMSQVLTE